MTTTARAFPRWSEERNNRVVSSVLKGSARGRRRQRGDGLYRLVARGTHESR